MELNQQQVAGWLRATLSAGGPIAALVLSKTGMSQADWALYTEIALALIPGAVVAVWSWFRNRHVTQIRLIEKSPDVAVVPLTQAGADKIQQATGIDKPVEPITTEPTP